MAIKCVKQLKRDDLTDNYEKYVKSGMSEYDAGIQVASELHRELFDEIADFRATVLGEDAEQAKAKYVPFDTKDINAKYQGIAIERDKQAKLEIEKQKAEAKRVAEEAKAEAERAEAARIKAETPKIKVEKKPVPTIQDEPTKAIVDDTTLLQRRDQIKAEESKLVDLEREIRLAKDDNAKNIATAKLNVQIAKVREMNGGKPIPTVFPKIEDAPAKKTIAKKPLTEIKPQGKKTYWKVEFPTKEATIKESVEPSANKPLVRDLTPEEIAQRVKAAPITKTKNGYVVKDLWSGKTFETKAEAETAVQDWAKGVRKVEMADWRNATDADLYTEQKALRRVAESLKTDTDLSDLLARVEKHPQYGEKGNLLWSIAQNPNASASTKAKALKAYDADRDLPSTATYSDGTRTGTLETMPNGTQRIRLRPAKAGSPMDGTTAFSAKWKPEAPMESSQPLDTITDSKGNINYEAVKNVAGRIERGEATIKRLDTDGEQGRIAGGKRAIESSIILARGERASEESGSRTRPFERQERTLEEYAKSEGIWLDPRELQQNIVGKGNEATVHSVDDGKSVQKGINYKQIDKNATPLDFIDNRIATFNHLFPDTKYELVGFTRTKDGFRFVIKQPFIRDAVYTTPAERQAFMKSKGFEMVDKYGEEFANEFYHVSDLHEKNALKMPDGSIVVIDAVTKAKPVSEFEIVDKLLAEAPTERSREEMEASKESFKNAQNLDIPDLLNIVDVSKMSHDDGIIDMADVPEFELVRRVMGNAFGNKVNFDGIFTDPSQVKAFVKAARELATQAKDAGFDGKPFSDLAKVVQDAAKANGTVIFYIADSALAEEKFHRALFTNRVVENRAKQIPESVLNELHAMPVVQEALKGQFGKLYGKKSKAVQMEEFAVKSALGELEGVDKRAAAEVAIRYLEAYAENNQTEGVSKDDLLTKLATEITYGEEVKAIQREAEQGKTSAKDSDKQAPDGEKDRPVSGERGEKEPTGNVTSTRVTPVLQSREPGKSGVDFDADEAQQAKERGQKILAFSRVAGQELYYTPQTNEETEAMAVQLISDIGTQEAIQNALTGKPDAAGMRVVYKEFARLNALHQYHKEQGNLAEAQVVGDYLAPLANAIIERQLATGRESQIARTLDVLSPDIAVLMAQRRILNTRGVGATLTDEELAETQELGREAQEIEAKLEKERKGLQKSTKKERELDDDTKPSKFANTQEQLLKDYRKQKKEIVNKLADLFPNSSLFDGETEMMMSAVGDTSKYENLDPTQIAVLTQYATGEILEGLPYENLIKTIEALGVSPTDAQQIHADAVDIIKPAREPRTEAAKERAKVRREHYKQAKAFNSDGKAFLSGIAQDASLDSRYKDNDLLIKAIDFLTNPKNKDKNLNGLINMIRKDNQMSIQDAENLAHEARKAADTIKAERKVKKDEANGISKEHRAAINELTVEKRKVAARMNKHLRSLNGKTDYLMKRFNNVMRGAFVSNYFTQLFNAIQAGTVSAPAEMGLDFIAKMLTGVGINVGENTDIDAKDLILPYAYILANDKQMAEQALAYFPEEYFRIHSGILGDIQIEKRAQSDAAHPLTKPFHKVFDLADYGLTKLATVTGAKFQEMYFRNAMIAARFDQIIRNKSGRTETLKSSLENGTFLNYITQKDAQKAGDDALEVTYASEINDPLGKVLKTVYDKLDNFVPIFLNPVTYARFTYTVTKGMVLNPLMFGALDAQVAGGRGYNNRSIAKGVLGYSGILTAYLLQGMLGGDDDRWDTLYLNGKDNPPLSVKRFFPLSGYFYMAHLLRNFKEGGTPPTTKEILEGFASLESDYFTYGAGMELAGAIKDYPTSNDSKAVTAASARLFGNFLSGLGRFFAPMKAVVAQLSDDERALKEYSDSPKDKFISEVSKSIPFISKLSDAKASRDVNGNPILIPFPIGRAVGLNFVHPSLISPKDSPATQWANEKFKFKGEMGTMSAEDRKMYQARKRIKNAWRTGNQITVEQALKNMMVDLPEGSLNRLKDELKYSELGAMIKYGFGMNDKGDVANLRKVWSKTTAEEKDELRTILKTKQNLTPEFREEFGLTGSSAPKTKAKTASRY